MNLATAQRILADKTRHIQSATHCDRDWNRLIHHLNRLPTTKKKLVNVIGHTLRCVTGFLCMCTLQKKWRA
uniref:hypothetical protein n=1 Tax=Aeromonas hydrophila TaxID=644 RepID=UPI000B21153E|nr:hypothetical protein [Aeromonas hydrophila]